LFQSDVHCLLAVEIFGGKSTQNAGTWFSFGGNNNLPQISLINADHFSAQVGEFSGFYFPAELAD
jgi:hypothetical protein